MGAGDVAASRTGVPAGQCPPHWGRLQGSHWHPWTGAWSEPAGHVPQGTSLTPGSDPHSRASGGSHFMPAASQRARVQPAPERAAHAGRGVKRAGVASSTRTAAPPPHCLQTAGIWNTHFPPRAGRGRETRVTAQGTRDGTSVCLAQPSRDSPAQFPLPIAKQPPSQARGTCPAVPRGWLQARAVLPEASLPGLAPPGGTLAAATHRPPQCPSPKLCQEPRLALCVVPGQKRPCRQALQTSLVDPAPS